MLADGHGPNQSKVHDTLAPNDISTNKEEQAMTWCPSLFMPLVVAQTVIFIDFILLLF